MSVKCPPGRHVYGGGGGVPVSPGSNRLVSSFPIDSDARNKTPDDGWRISVDADNPVVTLLVTAACGKTMPTYVESTADVTPFSTATLNVGCGVPPFAQQAIGGGQRIGGGFFEVFLGASIVANPYDFTVYQAAMTNQASQDVRFTAYAICGDPSDFG